LSVKYRFVHALYQDALYRSLGPTRRASTSAAVAHALATAWAGQVNARSAELGYLYEAARDFSRAAEFFLIASERARQIFADRDALALARRAMTNLQALPESPERASREVMHLMAIALPMHSVHGYAARELEATYARARQLCDELGEHPLRFGVITGISAFHFMRAELRTTEQLIDKLLRLSAQTGNPVMRIWALWVHGSTYSHIGEKYDEAFARLDEGVGLYTRDLHPAFMLLTGFDAGIGCQMQAARLAWVLGRADEAGRAECRGVTAGTRPAASADGRIRAVLPCVGAAASRRARTGSRRDRRGEVVERPLRLPANRCLDADAERLGARAAWSAGRR
jgi:hypothetical protein